LGKSNNVIVGDRGESLATNYLKKNKYKILETKYKNTIGEIDIIAKQKNVIVFVEVKSRTNDFFGAPSEAVNTHKQHKIRNVAMSYLKAIKKTDSLVRFDVIEVVGDTINHIENCF